MPNHQVAIKVLDGLPPDDGFLVRFLQPMEDKEIQDLIDESQSILECAEKESINKTFIATFEGDCYMSTIHRCNLRDKIKAHDLCKCLDVTSEDSFFVVTKSGWIVKYMLKGAFLLAEDSETEEDDHDDDAAAADDDDDLLSKNLAELTIQEPPKTRSKTRDGTK